MTRPSTHDDLDDYRRQGHTLFNWYSDLGKHPVVEQHIVKAKLEAERLGYEVTHSEVRVPLTTKELDTKLKEQQDRYDQGLDIYAELVAGPREYADLTYSEKGRAEFYAECEGVVAPDKVEKITPRPIELALED